MADHKSNEDATTAAGASMIALSVIVVACRFYMRLKLKSGLKWDDWFILISLLSLITAGVLVVAASTVDPDFSWLEISYSDPDYIYTPANETHLLLSWLSSVFYYCIVCAAKMSILFMYKRIFSISVAFRRQVYAVIAILTMYWVAIVLADIFNCIPFKYSWTNSNSPAPYCFNFNLFWFSSGIIETVLDVVIISLPVNMVARLHLSMRKRIGLGGVFLLGAFGIVTGAIRVWTAYRPGQRSPSWGESEVWSSIHASPIFSKVRGSTVSLRDRWRSRHSPHSYGPKSTGDQSREDKDRSEGVSSPGLPDTELLPVSRRGVSPDVEACIAYPQQVRAISSSDSEDGVLIIQGGHNTERQRFVGYGV
ncbi:hypothetical protein LA080_006380 [Diaporthe eres]|nr:hypothetical protein LA080_006380 [Diaporthe eres]